VPGLAFVLVVGDVAYQRLCHKKQHTGTAKVMVARKLTVRLGC